MRTEANSYCVEAVVPLKSIGLKIEPNASYKFDWGILVSGPGGSEVTQRLYWANAQTGILADEAIESQLHPDLWGTLRFLPNPEQKTAPKVDLDDLLNGKVK